jgi:predicted RNA-binding protein with PIN domain
MPYLVDGNNLAHALGLENGGFADRASCAKTVAAFCRSHGARAIVVFDGKAPESPQKAAPTDRVRLIFAEGRSADDVILRMVADSKTPKDFTVVTSDKSLGDKARHRGAAVERAHEFSRRLERSPKGAKGTAEKPSARETPEEIAAWLAVFDPKRP